MRDELVGNYYSDGTLERLAVHLRLLKDYLRFLAGDLSHSRSVSGNVHPLKFLGSRFDLIYSCKLSVECPFLGSRVAALDEEYVSTYFLDTSKGWSFSGFSYLA